MPKPKPSINPSDVRHPLERLADAVSGMRANPSRDNLTAINTRYWDLKQSMDILMNRTDGWMRVIPQPDDNKIYLKWKYTRGTYEGCYVMAVVQNMQLPDGIMLLCHKVIQADQGLLRPTRDRLYDDEGS